MFVVFPAVIIVIASALLGGILFFFAVGLVWNVRHFAARQDQRGRQGALSRNKSTR